MSLKIVAEGNPYFREMLDEALLDSSSGSVTCMALVYIMDDKIYTDWVKSDNASVCELTGAAGILYQDLIDKIRTS